MVTRQTRDTAHANRQEAFTLTELLVVIGIVILVATMTIPAVLPFMKRQALRAGARSTQAMVFHARSAAISERCLAGAYLYVQDFEDTVGTAPDGLWPAGSLIICYDSDDDGYLDEQLGGVANLPISVHFSIVDDSASDVTLDNGAARITYTSRGLVKSGDFANGLNVRVVDAAGAATTITVPGYLGR